tara:strand:- start:12589 stop:13677 length:1089 start_codon:yes stop_codon:yes gene_type:complete
MGYDYNADSKAGYDSSNYLMQRTSTAGQAAATGASIGSAIGPWGTVIGAGVGGIAGFAAGGPNKMQRMRDEELKEYMRRKELGMLGLTPEELQIISAQMKDPLLAGQRQADQAYKAGLGIADVGAGAVAQQGIARQAAEAQQMAQVNQQIQAANLQKKIAEENIIQNMITKREQEIDDSKKGAIVAGAQLALELGDAGTELGEGRILRQQELELQRAYEEATGITTSLENVERDLKAAAEAGYLSDEATLWATGFGTAPSVGFGTPPPAWTPQLEGAPGVAPAANAVDLGALSYPGVQPSVGFGTPYPGVGTQAGLGIGDPYGWGGTAGDDVPFGHGDQFGTPGAESASRSSLIDWLLRNQY